MPARPRSYIAELPLAGTPILQPLPAMRDGRMLTRPDGRRWLLLSQRDAMLEQPDGSWLRQSVPIDAELEGVTLTPDGRLVLMTSSRPFSLAILDGTQSQVRRGLDHFEDCYGPSVAARRDGTLVVGFRTCAAVMTLSSVTDQPTWSSTQNLAGGESTRAAVADGDNGVWLLPRRGATLLRLAGNGQASTMKVPSTPVWAADQAPDGSMWVTAGCDVMRVVDGIVTASYPVGFPAWRIDVDGEGRLLLSGHSVAVRGSPASLPTALGRCDLANPTVTVPSRKSVSVRSLRQASGYAIRVDESSVVSGWLWFERGASTFGLHSVERYVGVDDAGAAPVTLPIGRRLLTRIARLAGRRTRLQVRLTVQDVAGNATPVTLSLRTSR